MGVQETPTPEMIAQASEWAALLDDDATVTPDQRIACENWCAGHPLHRVAFDRIARINAQFDSLDAIQRNTLGQTSRRKSKTARHVASAFALALLVGTGWISSQTMTIRGLWPDEHTAIGQQREVTLVDGSKVLADTDTAFDGFDAGDAHDLTLFKGRVMVTVAPDKSKPFTIRTADGTATALGTVYSVTRSENRTLVAVIESSVRMCTSAGACHLLHAGQQAGMTADQLGRVEKIDPEVAALWASGWIEAHDRPLPEILADLARYRVAPLHYNAANLSAIRVTGSYPLANPDAALRSIAEATGLELTIDRGGRANLTAPAR